MKRIVINLYPNKDKTDKKFLKLIKKYASSAFLAVIILVAVNITLFIFSSLSSLPYNSLSKKWQNLTPQAAVVNSLKNELTFLREKKEKYQNLVSYNIEISHIFADAFKSLPKNIWLKEIVFSEDRLSLIGCVVEWKEERLTSINRFIKNLQKEPYFSKTFKYINPASQRKKKFFGLEIMEFEVECKSSN